MVKKTLLSFLLGVAITLPMVTAGAVVAPQLHSNGDCSDYDAIDRKTLTDGSDNFSAAPYGHKFCVKALEGNDTVIGEPTTCLQGNCADLFFGYGGIDNLQGELGNDELHGQSGNDIMAGDDGRDDLSGGSGADDMTGGAGDDEFYDGEGVDDISGGADDDTAYMCSDGVNDNVQNNVEHVIFTGTACID